MASRNVNCPPRRAAHCAILVWSLVVVGCRISDSGSPALDEDITVAAAPDTLITTASALIGRVGDLLVAPDGSVYLADVQANHILVLDAGGRVTSTIGREGSGPGEFSRPAGLVLMGDTLGVVDHGNGRLQFLSLDGAALGTMPLPAGAGPPFVGRGLLFVAPTWGADTVLAIIRDRDLAERARIGRTEGSPANVIRLAELKTQIRGGGVPNIFLNTADAAVGDDGSVWLTVAARASVDRFDSTGAHRWSMTISEPAFEQVQEQFIQRNAEAAPNQLIPLRYILDTHIVNSELWVLLGQSYTGEATIRVVRGDGTPGPRLTFTAVTEVERFAIDAERRTIFFVRPETAELVRVSY